MIFRLLCSLLIFSTPLFAEKSQEAFRDKSIWFNAFLEATDQKVVLREKILSALKKSPLWKQIENPSQELSFLFVGAGNGGIEIPLTQDLVKARSSTEHLSVYCEDPSEQMRGEFYQNAKEAGILPTVKEYVLLKFEDPNYKPHPADFVLASHVWYYIKEWKNVPNEKNSLVKFTNLIKPHGVGLITLQSKTSDRYNFLSLYSELTHQERDVSGEDLAAECDLLSIPYIFEIVEAHTSLRNCFQNGRFNPNMQGKYLLSFFLRTWWDDIPKEIQERLISRLLALVKRNGKEEFVFRDTFLWFP